MTQERRHFVRVPFVAPALLSLSDADLQVRVLDLSLKGALVQTIGDVQPVAQARGQLMVPLGDDLAIEMEVQVAHLENGAVGLRCLALDLDSVTHLRCLIALQMDDVRLLDRELGQLCQPG